MSVRGQKFQLTPRFNWPRSRLNCNATVVSRPTMPGFVSPSIRATALWQSTIAVWVMPGVRSVSYLRRLLPALTKYLNSKCFVCVPKIFGHSIGAHNLYNYFYIIVSRLWRPYHFNNKIMLRLSAETFGHYNYIVPFICISYDGTDFQRPLTRYIYSYSY